MEVELLETDEEGAFFEDGVALEIERVQRLRLDHYEVPHLTVIEYPGNPDLVSIVIDNRLAYDVSRDILPTVAKLVANAMAVAAGRTSHGPNSNIRNPHGANLAGYPTEHVVGTPIEGPPDE